MLTAALGPYPSACCTGEGGLLGGISGTNDEGDYVCEAVEPLIFWDCLEATGFPTCVVGGQFDGTNLLVTYVIDCTENDGSPFPITTGEVIPGLDIFGANHNDLFARVSSPFVNFRVLLHLCPLHLLPDRKSVLFLLGPPLPAGSLPQHLQPRIAERNAVLDVSKDWYWSWQFFAS